MRSPTAWRNHFMSGDTTACAGRGQSETPGSMSAAGTDRHRQSQTVSSREATIRPPGRKHRPERRPMGSIRMQNNVMRMAELDLRVVQPADPIAPQESPVVLLLHGFSMRADDLAPFGASMGRPAVFVFPEGPIDLSGAGLGRRGLGGRAWWKIDAAARDAAVARGADRDLSAARPAGLGGASAGMIRLVAAVRRAWPERQ